MIIGYVLIGSDNSSDMIKEGERLDAPTCPRCGYLLDFDYHNPFFNLRKKTFDFSSTYDIGTIVSLRFKEFCLRENYQGLAFKEFEREPNFFQFLVKEKVEFDARGRGTEFINYCPTCGNYEQVIGATPAYLKTKKEIQDGFFRTDLVFGPYNRKNPLIIVGAKTKEKLKREKMKGIYFEAIKA